MRQIKYIFILALSFMHPAISAMADNDVNSSKESSSQFFAQIRRFLGSDEVRRNIRRGNHFMHTGQRDKAVESYIKAYQADSSNVLAAYNLATSYFPDEWKLMPPDSTRRDSVMIHHFLVAGDKGREPNRVRRSMAFHNIGVMHQVRASQAGMQKVNELLAAIEAYKQALRENPLDDEARYNLVLCQRQLPKGGQSNDGDNQQDEGEQNQEDNQPQPSGQDDSQQQQQPLPQNNNQDEWVDQILNAAEQREKQVRRRLDEDRQANPSSRPRRNEKNW